MMKIDKDIIKQTIRMALDEDIGTGDITTQCTIGEDVYITGRFIAKQDGVICGMDIMKAVFDYVDETIEVSVFNQDGDDVKVGDIIAEISGKAVSILPAERLAINLMQRMSGIATQTKRYTDIIKDYKTQIVDTRKTTPGLRVFEKYAVRCGGGKNHRFNLADGILIKDNHIKASGSITNAVKAAKKMAPHTLKIEVEAETKDEVKEALNAGADIIMLDNMSYEEMERAVKFIDGSAIVEASGNMDTKDLKMVAETGVDYISMGALTHSVKALDISLKFD